ncbi:hypothetical protein BU251_02870 [Candidatus Velamenicoccus archaeovorus]|jgi:hypothetical protein|uniref:Uncharacterized protein n=1 Tax=Velamenicoccus archaeovorus TaxID=1930593 RepID=A0A410P3P6_VELA1|nr:hypothetical protein [Candidatus Velamenicoccus archaeovorus]MDD3983892.1 hypothetical protein [Candidatus Omnitrophota bacterium]QAT16750.1 hypothetical protein BU251_02870 [Candidatus Velamenicoccus archaeovorus]HOD12287.1 hypothetical protein [Candidatus Omnitrophota bacterium]HOY09543.1 hypothetical protein [Candidatus Omnitrophota bacterium]
MSKDVRTNNDQAVSLRGWDALEIKLKGRGLSSIEIQEARKSFFEGIELLSKMFLSSYDAEKKTLV